MVGVYEKAYTKRRLDRRTSVRLLVQLVWHSTRLHYEVLCLENTPGTERATTSRSAAGLLVAYTFALSGSVLKLPCLSFKISAMWMLLNRFLKNASNLPAGRAVGRNMARLNQKKNYNCRRVEYLVR